jgi:hypothetical protein
MQLKLLKKYICLGTYLSTFFSFLFFFILTQGLGIYVAQAGLKLMVPAVGS